MPNPVGPYETNDYCAIEDVQARLYSGQGLPGVAVPPVDATRDAILVSLITQTARDFDHEVWGSTEYPGLFSWRLETRLFSGRGDASLLLAPCVKVIKVEMDATAGADVGSWQDYTVEFSQRRMGLMPIRGYPKTKLFRMSAFWADPFLMGNVRITGIWGVLQPSPYATPPDASWETTYLTPITTNDPAGLHPTLASSRPVDGGWWATPDDVRAANASWVVHRFQAAKTGYGVSSGTGGAKMNTLKTIPDDVQRVINRYKGEHHGPKFALVANDGSDLDVNPSDRWAGWYTR